MGCYVDQSQPDQEQRRVGENSATQCSSGLDNSLEFIVFEPSLWSMSQEAEKWDTKLLIRSRGHGLDPSIQDLENMAHTDVMNMMYRMGRRMLHGGFERAVISEARGGSERADSNSIMLEDYGNNKAILKRKRAGKDHVTYLANSEKFHKEIIGRRDNDLLSQRHMISII